MTTTIGNKREAEATGAVLATSWPLALGLFSMVLAAGGHLVLAQRTHPIWGAIMLGAGVVLFLLPPVSASSAVLKVDEHRRRTARHFRPLISSVTWRAAMLVNCAVLAAVAYVAFEGNRLDRGFWFWLLAAGYWGAALAQRPAQGWRRSMAAWVRSLDWRTTAAVAAITGLAIFFRVFRLEAVPVEMTSDHAEKLLDVYDVLEGLRPIYFTRNTGREALQFYLTAGIVAWTPLPLGHLALKVGTVLFGIFAVPATYVLGKAFYGRRAGLLAAFLLAISHWHVTISRVGLRFPFTAAFTAPALYFLLRALRENRRNDWLLAGALLGAGLHTYTAMRIVPFLFVLLVAVKVSGDLAAYARAKRKGGRLRHEDFVALDRNFWKNALAGFGSAALVFLPLLRYMVDSPDGFWYRAASRAQETLSTAQAWGTFWYNVKNALLMFNYRGDVVPMNTVPEAPVLGPVTGGLFILGIGCVLWRLVARREREATMMLTSFFVLLLPSILSLAYPGENPSVVRAGGVIPIVMIIAALPATLLQERLAQSGARRERLLGSAGVVIFLVGSVVFNYQWYFVTYDQNVRRSLWNATEMGAVLREFERGGGALENAYHVAYPHWVDTRNIGINAGDVTWRNAVTDLAHIALQAQLPGRKLYLVHPAHEPALKVLREVYPQGNARLVPSQRPGKQFIVFEVPK